MSGYPWSAGETLTAADLNAAIAGASIWRAGLVTTIGTNLTLTGGVLSAAAAAGVTSFNGRSAVVTLLSADVTGALTYTPAPTANPTFTGTVTAGATNVGAFTATGITATPISGSTGSFTTLAASSTVSGTGFSNYLASPPAIGGSAAAAGSFTTLSGSVTATGSTTARTLAARAADVVNALDYGVVADGVTDNATALAAFFAALTSQKVGVLPQGVINFNSGLTLSGASNVTLRGSGPYSTVLRYAGASTTTDLLTVTGSSAVKLAGFRFSSSTTMTAGAALHVYNSSWIYAEDVIADGQNGTGKLYHGFWWDRVDFCILERFEARGAGDGLRVNGTVGTGKKADLLVHHGKIASCAVGVRVGGAFGGFCIDACDIISNGTNCIVDTTLAAEGNREVFLGPNALWDSATTGDCITVDDALASGGSLAIMGWVASSATAAGIHIIHWSGSVTVSSPQVFNNATDGVLLESASTALSVGASTAIRGNSGYGIRATVTISVNCFAYMSGNTSGNLHSNVTAAMSTAFSTPGVTVTGPTATIGSDTGTGAGLVLDSATTTTRYLRWQTAGLSRWTLSTSSGAESGGNAGCDLVINRYTDAGSFVDAAVTITRSSGLATFAKGAVITGGASTIDGATIGATTASTGAFTTLSASSTVSGTGFSTYLASPPAIGGSAAAAGSFTTLSASSTVSGAGFSTYLASPPAIGGSAAAAGSFTTLSASSTVSGTGFSTYLASPPAIGGSAAAAGSFTTLSASSTVSGTGFSTYLASPPAIGGSAAAAGSFTTLSASSTVSGAGFSTYLASPPAIGGSAAAAGTFTALTVSTSGQFNADLFVGANGSAKNLWANGPAASFRSHVFSTAGTARWNISCDSTAESGANAGSDLQFRNYNDAGSNIATPLKIVRSTGVVQLATGVAISGTSTIDAATIGGTTAAAGTFTTVRATSTITPSATSGIVGTTTNDSANAGSVGEVISSAVLSNAVSLSNATAADVTTISLTAGDWDVSGEVWIVVGTGGATAVYGAITGTSATLPTGVALTTARANIVAALTASNNNAIALRSVRISLSGTTTYYLVGQCNFPSGTVTAGGVLWARRAR